MLNVCSARYSVMERGDLREVPLPSAGDRSRWKGIQHGELMDTIEGVLKDDYKMGMVDERYAVSPNQAKLVGGFKLRELKRKQPKQVMGLPHKTELCMGIRHGNDSTFALTCSLGASVLVCENGLIIGEYTAKHRHSSKLKLEDYIRETFEGYFENLGVLGDTLSGLAERNVTPADHDAGILQLARTGCLPWRLAGDVDKLWRKTLEGKGPHNGAFDGRTAWDWYNHVNDVIKRTPPIGQLRRLHQAYRISSGPFATAT